MQIFENKGSAMGCSNPHPHGQIWTTTSLPEEPATELNHLIRYRREQGGVHMLEDYARMESSKGERTVFENHSFWAGCPWWGTWPFEVMVIAKAHKRALVDLFPKEKEDLAEVVAEITRRYDNLFETSFPYSEFLHSILVVRVWFADLWQVWEFIRRRFRGRMRRLSPRICICISILLCCGVRV